MDWKRDVPLMAMSNLLQRYQVWIRFINVFFLFQCLFSFLISLPLAHFLRNWNNGKIIVNLFGLVKLKMKHFWSDWVFKGIVVNCSLPSLHLTLTVPLYKSFKITLTVPLNKSFSGQPHSTNSHNGHNHPLEHLYRD